MLKGKQLLLGMATAILILSCGQQTETPSEVAEETNSLIEYTSSMTGEIITTAHGTDLKLSPGGNFE
ncbi:MAG: hypothetical protein KJO90_01625, partial [Eudoraea sp.]|nr:hypothetical protein [Eudoraea sp.]